MRHLVFLALIFSNISFGLSVGEKAPDFVLKAIDGKEYSLKQARAGGGAIVLFVGARCPYSNAYNERYNQLASELSKKQGKTIALFAVDSNDDESVEDVKRYASDHHFTFPMLKDASHKVADGFGADRTPEAFLVGATGEVLYHGRIDDDTEGKHVTRQDLLSAVDEYLAGKPVTVKETKAFGCSIVRK